MYQIIWSTTAQETYQDIVNEVASRWGVNIAFNLDLKVVELLDLLEQHKHLCPPSKAGLR